MASIIDIAELKQLHQCADGCAPTTRCSSRLNKFCHSLDTAENALRFRQAPEKYCREFNLQQEELEAVTDLDIGRLLELGTGMSCLEHLTRVYGLSATTLGAQQAGITEEEFIALLPQSD